MERQRIEHELEETKDSIQKSFEPLPVLLSGQLCDQLRKSLVDEQRSAISPERVEHLRNQVKEIGRRVFISPEPIPPEHIRMSKDQIDFYQSLFYKISEDVLELKSPAKVIRLHDIGEVARGKVFDRLEQVRRIGHLLRDDIDRRERLTNDLRDVETKIQSTSDDPHINELISENRKLSERMGRLKQESTAIEADIQRLEADLATRRRQVEDRQEKRRATTEAKRVVKLAQQTRRVLDDFIKALAPEKLNILKSYFEDMYGRLRKPEDPVKRIDIDADTWQILLYDEKGRILEKRVFSAGMREMYSLALLWALARASGKELPIVIDTPVGRLDTTNRRALFERYLPHAGHQVVVLSTDTEVDVEWAKRLSPFVAKQYHLDYDATKDSVMLRPGYFF